MTKNILILSVSLLFSLSTFARPNQFTGYLYEIGSDQKKLLYTFDHKLEKSADTITFHNEFKTPEKEVHVVEEVKVIQDKIQEYKIDHKQIGEKGKLTIQGNKAIFEYTKKDGETKKSEEEVEENFVIGPLVPEFLKRNWKDLVEGKKVSCRFAVLDRRETVGFTFKKFDEKKINGKDVVVIEMKPTSFIISALVKPLFFTLEKESALLVHLVGRTLPKKKVGNSFKDLDVEITYDYSLK